MQTSKYCYLHAPRVSKPSLSMQQDQGATEETTTEEGIVKVIIYHFDTSDQREKPVYKSHIAHLSVQYKK